MTYTNDKKLLAVLSNINTQRLGSRLFSAAVKEAEDSLPVLVSNATEVLSLIKNNDTTALLQKLWEASDEVKRFLLRKKHGCVISITCSCVYQV